MVEVVAAVMMRDGKILIGQRKRGGRHPLKWEFPGGKVEAGEDPRAALARELREELNVDAVIGEELDSYEVSYGDGFRLMLHFYRVTQFQGELRNLDFEQIAVGDARAAPGVRLSSKATLLLFRGWRGRRRRRNNVDREWRGNARAHAHRHGLLRRIRQC